MKLGIKENNIDKAEGIYEERALSRFIRNKKKKKEEEEVMMMPIKTSWFILDIMT